MDQLSYRRHRFPPPIIQRAVWLYLRFTLSYRDVEELLAERGVEVSYGSVRRWVLKFGPGFARRLRALRPRPSEQWHLDEMVVRIAGKRMYLWRAVDHEGEVLDMLVQRRRDKRAALRLLRKLLRKQGFAPKLLTTDKLGSYGAAFRHLRLSGPHQQGLRANNRGELPSSGATKRAQNAEVQIGWFSPALSEHACRRPQHATFNAISSPGRPCGSSEPKRPRNGKTRSQQHEAPSNRRPSLPNPGCRDKALLLAPLRARHPHAQEPSNGNC
jgi:putative transposase